MKNIIALIFVGLLFIACATTPKQKADYECRLAVSEMAGRYYPEIKGATNHPGLLSFPGAQEYYNQCMKEKGF